MPTTSSETKTDVEATNNGTGNGFEEPNPFVQPGVPAKRQHTATVYYLDATKNEFIIHKNSDGQDLFNMVANHLRLAEKDYFALSYTNEKTSEREWLYNDQRISKQVGGRQWEFTFEFKFYPPEPSSLVDDLARRHLMLQCRRDVCSGRIPTSFATQALLASYLAQAELGDFSAPSEQYVDYLRSANVAPSVDDKLISKIQELHHQHRGQTASEAEINYLNTCKKLNMYGIYAFEGKDKSSPVTVGIGALGVNIYKDNVRIHRFPWQNIDKISYKNANFIVKLKPETVGKGDDRYSSTRMPDYHVAKKAWKTAVEHHTFFRLIQPETKPHKSLFRWGSQRFRYQGRTQFQTKMASQMFDHGAPATRPNDSARATSRSVDDIAQHAQPVHASPVRFVDDRTETRSPLSSPDQSYVVSSSTKEERKKKGKKGIDEEVGVRRLDYASSVPVTSAENLHAASSRPAPTTATTTASYYPTTAPQHIDHLQPFLRDQELQGTPVANMVSVYNRGFYEGHAGDDAKSPRSWKFWQRHKSPDSGSPFRARGPHLRHMNGTSSQRLQETARDDDMPSYPLRYFSSVYHSGLSLPHRPNRRFEVFEREVHAGDADFVEKTDLNLDNYLFAKTTREGGARLERKAEVESCPLRSTTQAYHSGRPPHRRRTPKRPLSDISATAYDTSSECSTCISEEETRTPKKMAVLHLKRPTPKKRFGFWKSSEVQHDTEPSTSKGFPIARDPYQGPLHVVRADSEFLPNPLRDDVQVYHSGRSRAPLGNRKKSSKFDREKHVGLEEEIEKEHIDKEAYVRHSEIYKGDLDETARRRDMETMPIKEFAKVYHPGESRTRLKKRRSGGGDSEESSAESVEDEEFTSPGRRGTNFFKFLRPSAKSSGYPEKSVFGGKLSITEKKEDLQEDPLRYSVAVYHSGLSTRPHWYGKSRLVHEGEEEVVQKNALNQELYPAGGEKYDGVMERTERGHELGTFPLRQYSKAYHSGLSVRPRSKRNLKSRLFGRRSESESEEEEPKKTPETPTKEKEGKLFAILHRSARKEAHPDTTVASTVSAYPVKSEKYSGHLDDTILSEDMDSEPLREKVDVYHSGYSLAPFRKSKFWTFERWTHPGEEEVLEKEKVNPESYQRSAEPFTGELHATDRNPDLHTVPLKQYSHVYHPGYYERKPKKAERYKSDKESGFESDPSTDSEEKRRLKAQSPRKDEKSKRSGSFGFGIRLPHWKFGGKSPEKDAGYPMSREPFKGTLDTTNLSGELQDEPLRHTVKVYHSGWSTVPGWRSKKPSDRVFHPGNEEVVDKEHLKDYGISKEPFEGTLMTTAKGNELDTVPVREQVDLYHPGHSYLLKVRKRRASESADSDSGEERDQFDENTPTEKRKEEEEHRGKRSGSFGIRFPSWKFPSWERSPGKETPKYRQNEEPFRGSLESTERSGELKGSPLTETPKRPAKDRMVGASRKYEVQEKERQNEQTPTEKFRRISDSERDSEMATTPRKPRASEESEEGRRGSFRFGIKFPKWKFGRKGEKEEPISEYPAPSTYSGPLSDTNLSKEIEPEHLRSKVKVYHPGYRTQPHREWHLFGRAKHPGEEEVVEKEKVKPESYPQSSEPFAGELHSTERGTDLATVPLSDHANVYHPGHSHTLKIGRRKEPESDEFESDGEGKGFSFGLPSWKLPTWQRDQKEKHSDYPSTEEYQGPLQDTPKKEDLKSEPLRDHAMVYHSGYSVRPHGFFERWFHPGEEEVVEKEKIDLQAYKKGAPFEGPLDETHRGKDVDTVPIRGYAKVYHLGQSDLMPKKVKMKKTSKDDEPSGSESESDAPKARSGSKSGRSYSFGLNFKMPKWKRGQKREKEAPISDYPSAEKYTGPLEDISHQWELRPSPLLQQVNVYHSGHSTGPLANRDPRGHRIKLVPLKGEDDDKENFQSPQKEKEEEGAEPEHAYSLKIDKTTKSKEEESPDEESKTSREGKGFGLSFKFPKWKFGRKGEKEEPISDYPAPSTYSGPLDDTQKSAEIEPEDLRSKVKVYHPGYRTQPHREWHLFGRAKHPGEEEVVEKEKVKPESYPISAEPFTGELHSTEKGKDLATVPLSENANVYHPGHSYTLKIGKRTEPESESEASDEEGKGFSFGLPAWKLPTWKNDQKEKRGPYADYPLSAKYQGPLQETHKAEDMKNEPIKENVRVYHSGHSIGPLAGRDPKGHKIKFTYPRKDVIEKERITESMRKEKEAEKAQMPESAPVPKTEKAKKQKSDSTSEDDEATRAGKGFGINFKLPSWKFGRKGEKEEPISDYPSTEKYSGPLADTNRSADIEPEDLRSKVKVYHLGYRTQPHREWHLFSRAKHPGEEEVVEKEKLKPESYPQSFEPFTGELHATGLESDMTTVPLSDHANVYHPGHSYTLKIGKRKEPELDESESEVEGKGFSFGLPAWKLPTWQRDQEEKHSDYPSTEQYQGPLESTNKDGKMQLESLREKVNVYHSGYSVRPHGFFERWFHPGEEEVVEKEKIDLQAYKKGEPFEGPLDETHRGKDLDTVPIRGYAKVYHPGQSDLKPKKAKKNEEDLSESEDETKAARSPSKSGRGFGFNFKLPSWKRGESSEHPSPEKEPKSEESKEYKQKSSKKYDVHIRTAHPGAVDVVEKEKVDLESYPKGAEPFAGPLDSTEKGTELDSVPIDQHARKYHPGKSYGTAKRSKKCSTGTPSEEEDGRRPSRSHSFGLNFKFPKWKFGRKGEKEEPISDYPSTEKYSGPLQDTQKSGEIEPEDLRSKVKVYHPGYRTQPHLEWHLFGRSKHFGEEEVVEKEKVKAESYPQSSEPFTGELHSTQKGTDLATVPLSDHANVYHPGHSHTLKIGRRKEPESDESESDGEGEGFSFGLPSWKLPTWQRDQKEKHSDYPSTEEYQGPLQDTPKKEDLKSEPLRDHATVYHSGYSVRPHGFFERWFHPGEEEVVEKEKIDLLAYKKGAPFEGPLDETHRGKDVDTVPIRGYAKVYHPGQSDLKPKKAKKKEEDLSESEDETKTARSPSKSGRGFGFNFKLPTWGRHKKDNYPSTEEYSGPLEDTAKNSELQPSPLRENVDVYHSGHPQMSQDPFTRSSHPGEEHTVEKEKVKFESYPRSAEDYLGPLHDIQRAQDLEATPLKEHSRAYHSGLSTKEPRKWRLSMRSASSGTEHDLNRTFDSVDSQASTASGRLGKLKFWRSSGRKEGPLEPIETTPDFPLNLPPFTGTLDSTSKAGEIEGGRLRDDVAVYHSGHSEIPRANRKYHLFGRRRHEGEEEVIPQADVKPESYFRSAEPFSGDLHTTSKDKDLESEPIRRFASVYHRGKSYVAKGKKKKAPESSSDASSDEDLKKHVGFLEKPLVVEMMKMTPREEKQEKTPETAKSIVIHVKSPRKTEEPDKESKETPKREKTKSPRRSGGPFGFWRSSGRAESPKIASPPRRSPYPATEKFTGVLDSTGKWSEVEGSPLRSAVDVYHSGQPRQGARSARFVHPGDVEVVAKEKVDPDSYRRTKTPYDGPLETTEKSEDLDTEPLRQHATVYHDGHSYVKARQVHKRTADEVSSSEDEPRAKRTHGETTPKTTEKAPNTPPKSAKRKRIRRKKHPGSVEIVKKEKVKPESYKRSPDPFLGLLDTTRRDVSFETEPILDHADVYHSGRSDLKKKKAKSPKRRKARRDKKRTAENGANEAPPARRSHRVRLFSRDVEGDKEEVVEKEKIDISKYPVACGPTLRIVEPLDHAGELHEDPIREHAKVYHSGQSVHQKTKRKPDTVVKVKSGYDWEQSTSGIESGDEESPPKRKRAKSGWRFRDLFRFPRKVDYTYPMITAPYRGPVESLDRQPEIGLSQLDIVSPRNLLDSEEIPRPSSPFSLKVTEVTLNVFVQNERVSEYHCDVVVGPWPETPGGGPGGAGLVRGMIGFEEERRAAEVDFVPAGGGNNPDPQPATMESSTNKGRSLFATIRRQLSQVTKKKDKKQKKEKQKKEKKKGVDVDSASATSSDSTDVEVTNREVVLPSSDNKENVTVTASAQHTTNDEPEDKTIPSGPYVPAGEEDGVVVREEKLEEVYRIVGSGNTPNMDPADTSLAGTVAQYIKENQKTPGVRLVEKNITVRELPGQLPTNVGEGSLPHTTIQSWKETAVGPESVTTDIDEHGNIVKRTVKTQQVKHTVQRQTYQTYTVNDEDAGKGHIETSRQMITPIGENGGTVSKSPVVETHTRTVAYENPTGEPPSDIPGEFVSSKTVTQGNRTVETITYKTEKDGVIETHVEHRVTIHSGSEIDHDAELSQAILEATNMNPDMTVERIEVKQESQC